MQRVKYSLAKKAAADLEACGTIERDVEQKKAKLSKKLRDDFRERDHIIKTQMLPTTVCATCRSTRTASSMDDDWELRTFKVGNSIPAERYLEAFDLLFAGEAELWLQENPHLTAYFDNPIEEKKDLFVAVARERFPEKKPDTKISFETELAKVLQNPDESLQDYYERTQNVILKLGIKDIHPSSLPPTKTAESLILESIIAKWIRG
ncbi:hypothetical protein AJ79_04420 [Helicocarpus griseus UAMH5409]|uniref:Retrotransposon gag domain-containing protein n=1 Tax=Helicocarpus griseus UAMH5409 TaxID=1447875 RepID=A0A2B7XTD0_9EURO|nr:hypothetical protein AJ79_04420 [Helicocarpus griseus UAMH5409]